MKVWIYTKLTQLRDKDYMPDVLVDALDRLRYDYFWPYDND